MAIYQNSNSGNLLFNHHHYLRSLVLILIIIEMSFLCTCDCGPTPIIQDPVELERSFKEFVKSVPESTVIGHVDKNSTLLELLVLRKKIADTILGMKELEKAKELEKKTGSIPAAQTEPECYIEVTKVERVPGRCQKVPGGSPVCYADQHLAVSSECRTI